MVCTQRHHPMETKSTDGTPDRRVMIALNRVIDISVPFHLKAIQRHKELIEKYRQNQELDRLLKEQIHGLQSVQRLKADLRELEALGQQLSTRDQQMVCQQIITIKTNVCSVVQQFIESNEDVSNPLSSLDANDDNYSEDQTTSNCVANVEMDSNMQIMADINEKKSLFKSWQTLSKELIDLNEMFNTIVSTLKGQKERVDSIETNINDSHHNVLIGTQHLSKASAFRGTTVALGAGLLGGAVFGPIGMLAGFKFSGVASALGAGIISYSGVKMIQRKAITAEDKELIENNDNKSEDKKSH